MKKILISLGFISVIVVVVLLSFIAFEPQEIGRYQLAGAEYITIDKTNGIDVEVDEAGLFKIDTVTGKTWKLVSEIEDVEDLEEEGMEGKIETESYLMWEMVY